MPMTRELDILHPSRGHCGNGQLTSKGIAQEPSFKLQVLQKGKYNRMSQGHSFLNLAC